MSSLSEHHHHHDHEESPSASPSLLDWEQLRARVANETGPRYWRSLEELAATPQFEEMVHREFPHAASEWLDPVGRRSFLKLMGASLGLAGLTACTRQPTEKIVPYTRAPEEITPGVALFYATAFPFNGYGVGVLAESHEGRPTKIEGNNLHPSSLGATDVFTQASILDLYDPDRSKVLTQGGHIANWERFQLELNEHAKRWRDTQGAGVRILMESSSSPTLSDQMQSLLKLLPKADVIQYDSAGRENQRRGGELAFGRPVSTRYDFSKAKVVLSLDCDFLHGEPGSIRYARDFAGGRRVSNSSHEMNRLYVVEPSPTITGAMGDHRLRIRRSKIDSIARVLAERLGVVRDSAGGVETHIKWIESALEDLQAHRGASIVIAGRSQPPIVHALVHAINQSLGNVGKTVLYSDAIKPGKLTGLDGLRQLASDAAAGNIDTLIVLGGNPVYAAPIDLNLRDTLDANGQITTPSVLRKIDLVIRLGLHEDETSSYAHWHVPAAHYLESWSDIRAYDGTASIVQPLIDPLYNGKTTHELLSMLIAAVGGETLPSSYELVRDHWRRQYKGSDFEAFWRRSLHDGVIEGSTAAPVEVSVSIPKLAAYATEHAAPASQPSSAGEFEITFAPDPSVWDGRFANNGWLQECPKPLTKLTWDNAVLISPRTAERLGIENEGEVKVTVGERSISWAAWILPGQPDDVITLHLGYGRTRTGRVGTKTGIDAGEIRTSGNLWWANARIEKTGEHHEMAATAKHANMDQHGRELVRSATLKEFIKDANFASEKTIPLSILPEEKWNTYSWGMSVNQNVCIGCNACVVACQAENNVPVVGKAQVIAEREMHWLRLDTYYEGSPEDPEALYQPMMCQHCEKAPCEIVCPVGATVHSAEGLNQMVYNRCVGTRYCSNNCPYKVRRFNFLYFTEPVYNSPTLRMVQNPDVTVRTRGVMEKCSYCIQRITAARVRAEKEERSIRDGDIVTACQQACPTQAIVFGDINDPNSAVSKMKRESMNYGVLTELNTQPRTTYLARLRNPKENT